MAQQRVARGRCERTARLDVAVASGGASLGALPGGDGRAAAADLTAPPSVQQLEAGPRRGAAPVGCWAYPGQAPVPASRTTAALPRSVGRWRGARPTAPRCPIAPGPGGRADRFLAAVPCALKARGDRVLPPAPARRHCYLPAPCPRERTQDARVAPRAAADSERPVEEPESKDAPAESESAAEDVESPADGS